MSSNFSMSAVFQKITHCKRLNPAEVEFVGRRYESLKRTYLAALGRCDEAERRAISLSESQCQLEARRMERDYQLALRLEEKLDTLRQDLGPGKEEARGVQENGIAYKVCLACYYDIQIENMLANQELPISSEFLSALSELEAALVHLNDITETERSRSARMWTN